MIRFGTSVAVRKRRAQNAQIGKGFEEVALQALYLGTASDTTYGHWVYVDGRPMRTSRVVALNLEDEERIDEELKELGW